ncbi:MAG: SDR family oxidoreductase [Acidimicrobiales bacterium]
MTGDQDQMRQFDQKVAVITGGSQGLGEATARLMAERGLAGAVLVGRNAERGNAVAEALPCEATFVAVDLGAAEAADEIMAATDDAFGRVDAVVNAAAFTVRGSVWDTDAEMWSDMLNVNTRAPAMLITAAAKLMKREGVDGTVVNIGSVAAWGGQDFLYPYSASKAALQAITRNAAHALMRHRIRVNLLQPGWMKTPGEDATQRRFHNADDGWLAEAEAQQPFGRLIDPVELARSICFLSCEESGMMTGAIIDFDQSVLWAGDAPRPGLHSVWGEETPGQPGATS